MLDIRPSPRVFLSYKWQDPLRNEWVERLCRDLRTRFRVDVQLDQFEVDLGESFSDYMISRIDKDTIAMLFVITPEAVRAVDETRQGGVHFEMQLANARRLREPGFRIIGIYREGNENTAYLRDHRYVDFRDDSKYEYALGVLADSLWGRSHRPPIDEQSSSQKPFSQEAASPPMSDFEGRAIYVAWGLDSKPQPFEINGPVAQLAIVNLNAKQKAIMQHLFAGYHRAQISSSLGVSQRLIGRAIAKFQEEYSKRRGKRKAPGL